MDIIAEIRMTINLLFKDGVVTLDLLLVHLKRETSFKKMIIRCSTLKLYVFVNSDKG